MGDGVEMQPQDDQQRPESRSITDPETAGGEESAPNEVTDIRGNKAPVMLRRLGMDEIDIQDETYQLRLGKGFPGLAKSLKRDGQHDPIKVMAGERGYVILDGFSRMRELRKLGIKVVLAIVYPLMAESDAWMVALGANLRRKNLTAKDRANAILRARKQGFTTSDIAALCRVDSRTVQRYLKLPERIVEHVDGKLVTLAHGAVLRAASEKMTDEELEDWADCVRRKRMSASRLEQDLTKAGLLANKPRGEKGYCSSKPGEVRMRARKLTKRSKADDLERARAELLEGMAGIEAILESLGGENKTALKTIIQSKLWRIVHDVACAQWYPRHRRVWRWYSGGRMSNAPRNWRKQCEEDKLCSR